MWFINKIGIASCAMDFNVWFVTRLRRNRIRCLVKTQVNKQTRQVKRDNKQETVCDKCQQPTEPTFALFTFCVWMRVTYFLCRRRRLFGIAMCCQKKLLLYKRKSAITIIAVLLSIKNEFDSPPRFIKMSDKQRHSQLVRRHRRHTDQLEHHNGGLVVIVEPPIERIPTFHFEPSTWNPLLL